MDTSLSKKELSEALKRIESENVKLHELNAKKDRLLSAIAHDLRSPFQSLLGLSEILSSEVETLPFDEIVKICVNLNKSINYQYQLLDHILEWARLQTGKIEFNPIQVELNDVVRRVISILTPAAINKEINLLPEIDKEFCVKADEDMLMVIFQNLVSNSIKFSYREGNVKISAVENENYHQILVIDEGIGMDKSTTERVFSFDSKFTTNGTEGELGTGIGLMITNEMIEKHGGKLSVESEYKKGAKFSFTLPK
jgi:signal transduction histidine kinase